MICRRNDLKKQVTLEKERLLNLKRKRGYENGPEGRDGQRLGSGPLSEPPKIF